MTPDALHVAVEDPAVRRERDDAFLDARAGAVVEADERRADRLGEVHHLVDLLGEHLAERAAEDREVLGEHEHLAAVDRAPAGDDAVGERPVVLDAEAVGPVAGEHVELDERVGVEQQLEALAGGELAPLVLALDRGRAPGVQRLFPQLGELLEPLLDRVGNRCDRAPQHRHPRPGCAPLRQPCGPGYDSGAERPGSRSATRREEHQQPAAEGDRDAVVDDVPHVEAGAEPTIGAW